MRVAFMGTPDFAVPTLSELIASEHEIVAVYCQPARKSGRGQKPTPSPVQQLADTHGLPVRTPARLKSDEEKDAFRALDLDIAVVAAYGLILPKAFLDAPKHGCINVHASLLPRWRGAAPIQRAIMAGDKETGVTIMEVEAGLDTGAMLLAERVTISPTTTAQELHDTLSHVGAGLIPRVLGALERGGLVATPQPDEGITYADKIEKSEARVDWTRTAQKLDWHVRGLCPFPGAWFEIDDHRIKVLGCTPMEGTGSPGETLDDKLTIACASGALRLTRVQRAGKAACSAEEFLRGNPIAKGTRLS